MRYGKISDEFFPKKANFSLRDGNISTRQLFNNLLFRKAMYKKAIPDENQHIISIRTPIWGQGTKPLALMNCIINRINQNSFLGTKGSYIQSHDCFFPGFENIQILMIYFFGKKRNGWFLWK